MKRTLHLFNPDHDLALANGDENFQAPASARKFADDLASFPLWYAQPGDAVWGAMRYPDWLRQMHDYFPALRLVTVSSKPDLSAVESLSPWGWNAEVAKRFSLLGTDSALIRSTDSLSYLRNLSHRATAISALQYLRQDEALASLLPEPAEILSHNDVAAFVAKHQRVIFKAPWSGSGKGLSWASGLLTDSVSGWCRNVIEKQGGVVAEQVYDNLQDFAMEFRCLDGDVSFAGYSLFLTERGIYRSNELLSNEAIELILHEKGISAELLHRVQSALIRFLQNNISTHFDGYLGVDMFAYRWENEVRLHPCVEINLRMTMGMVSRLFYDRFVAPGSVGRFYIDFMPGAGALMADHLQRSVEQPLLVSDGLIKSGYLSLNPVSKQAHYRARVEVWPLRP